MLCKNVEWIRLCHLGTTCLLAIKRHDLKQQVYWEKNIYCFHTQLEGMELE